MTSPDNHDPSSDYPPSRPTLKMLFGAVAVVIAAILLVNWTQVSAYAHISQIRAEIEHLTGL